MRVLLDECLPRKLKREIQGHFVRTVPEMGWANTQNGALLRLAEREFDVFITSDQNFEFQQNLRAFNLGVIVLVAVTNAIEDLKPLMPKAHRAIETIRRGELIYIRASDC